MVRKCINCSWEGDAKWPNYHCPICGDNTEEIAKDIPVIIEKPKVTDTHIFMAKASEEDEEWALKEEQKHKKRNKR